MAIPEYQKRAVKKYQEANYDFYKLRMPKGYKDEIAAKAKAEGISLNQYILDKLEGKSYDSECK